MNNQMKLKHKNEVPNPFKHRRVWLGLTQDQLAEKSGLSRQMVTELEAGLCRKPPDSLLRALSSSQIDARRLALDYASWVALRRRDNEYLFREDYTHPTFEAFIIATGGSVRGFCRALVIQRSLVQSFLNSGVNWELIENCLWHVSLSSDYTNWLHDLPRTSTAKRAA